MSAGCSAVVAGGTEGCRAGGTGYFAEQFVAGGTGAEDADITAVGVGVHFEAVFLVGFVNFHPSAPHVLYPLHIWGSVVPMYNS